MPCKRIPVAAWQVHATASRLHEFAGWAQLAELLDQRFGRRIGLRTLHLLDRGAPYFSLIPAAMRSPRSLSTLRQ
jgi:hypothetical protein